LSDIGQTIAGGNKEKIKELRDSIDPDKPLSQFELVPAANMQQNMQDGANEFFVTPLPCVPSVNNVNDVNQFFVADSSPGDQCLLAGSLASTADMRPSENHFFV
jgi:hypothetical protein